MSSQISSPVQHAHVAQALQTPNSAQAALIVIDVQKDFLPGGALAVADGDQVVPIINQLASAFGRVVLTQDWHPHDHASFASQQNAPAFSQVQLSYGLNIVWPDHCVQGQKGAQFSDDLDIPHAQLIIRKGFNKHIDSYSAFMEADGKTTTGLAAYLQAHHIQKVVCVGLATDYCVGFTALDAKILGFEVEVYLPACRAIDQNGSLADMLKQLEAAQCQLTY